MTDKADVTFIKEFDIQTKVIKDMLLDLETDITLMFRCIFNDPTADNILEILDDMISICEYNTEEFIGIKTELLKLSEVYK